MLTILAYIKHLKLYTYYQNKENNKYHINSHFLEDYAEPEEVFDRRRAVEEETARIRKMSALMKMVFENKRNGHEKQ